MKEKASSRNHLWARPSLCKLLISLVDLKTRQYALDDDDNDDDDFDEDDDGDKGFGARVGAGVGGTGKDGGGSRGGLLSGVTAARALRAAELRNLNLVMKTVVNRLKKLEEEGIRKVSSHS